MPKINPYALRGRVSPIETFTAEDPDNPGVILSLQLRALSDPEAYAAYERSEQLTDRFVNWHDGEPPPDFFPFNDGRLLKVSSKLFEICAQIEAMQQGPA